MANTAVYNQAGIAMTDQSDRNKSAALKEDGNALYRQGKVLEGKSNVLNGLAMVHSNEYNVEQRSSCTCKPQIWIQPIQLYFPTFQQRFTS